MSISSYDYYQLRPASSNLPGDIWQNIPIKSLGRIGFVNAIVITPACDLEQRKTEVINLIPVIPISEYFLSRPFYYEVWNSVKSIFSPFGNIKLNSRFSHPRVNDIESIIDLLDREKDAQKIERCQLYSKYIRYTLNEANEKPDVKGILGSKEYNRILESIFRNNYRSDIHFLPATVLGEEYGIASHSVAMFRYIFSLDLSILDEAQTILDTDWTEFITSKEKLRPDLSDFRLYPVKVCKMKDDFLNDLLARHLSMHMRFGSRDFTSSDLDSMRGEI